MSPELLVLIKDIFELCIFPLLIALSGYLIAFINNKSNALKENVKSDKEKKYINMLNSTITDCVIATTQTYVESLKKQGQFDIEAQKVAFTMTYNAVINLLTEEAEEYLSEAVGDLNLYITQRIESEVKLNK